MRQLIRGSNENEALTSYINLLTSEHFKNCDTNQLLQEIGQYAEEDPLVSAILETQGIDCLIATPLTLEGRFVGFLGVDNPRVHQDQKLFLTILAVSIYKEILHARERDMQEEMSLILSESKRAQEEI